MDMHPFFISNNTNTVYLLGMLPTIVFYFRYNRIHIVEKIQLHRIVLYILAICCFHLKKNTFLSIIGEYILSNCP
jgi:hypothetical protein